MAELTQTKNKIIIECDCGIIHKISKDNEGNLFLKSIGTKNKKVNEDEETKSNEKSDRKPDSNEEEFKLFDW